MLQQYYSINYFMTKFNVTYTADCGLPPEPVNGYIIYNDSTAEGSEVVIACQSAFKGYRTIVTTVCDHRGHWQPNISTQCTSISGIITIIYHKFNAE